MTPAEVRAIVSRREFKRFRESIRILISIESLDAPATYGQRIAFERDPVRFFITCGDPAAARLWRTIEERQPEELKSSA